MADELLAHAGGVGSWGERHHLSPATVGVEESRRRVPAGFGVVARSLIRSPTVVPSGDERLFNIPLPWSTTVSIGPDVAQLQVAVGDNGPGCNITLNGEVVAEKPDGGDAHCVFDR